MALKQPSPTSSPIDAVLDGMGGAVAQLTESQQEFLDSIPRWVRAMVGAIEDQAKALGLEENWKGAVREAFDALNLRQTSYDRSVVLQLGSRVWRGMGQIPPAFVDAVQKNGVPWASMVRHAERAPKFWHKGDDGRTYGWNGKRAVPDWAWDAYSKQDVKGLMRLLIPGVEVDLEALLDEHLPQKRKTWAATEEEQQLREEARLQRMAAKKMRIQRGPGRPRKVVEPAKPAPKRKV